MAWLLLSNAVLFAFLFTIWSKSDLLNVFVKTIFLVLTLANGFQCYQAFEAIRIEASKGVTK